MVGADRANDDGQRALPAGDRRAFAARAAEMSRSSTRPGFAACRGRRTRSCRAPLRRAAAHRARPAVEADDFARRCPPAGVAPLLPSAVNDQRLREGGEDLGAFRLRGPRPACRMSRCGRWRSPSPSASRPPSRGRALRLRCPARRWPDFGRQALDDVPGIIVLERGLAQRGHLGDLRRRRRSRLRRRERRRRRGAGGEQGCFMPRCLASRIRGLSPPCSTNGQSSRICAPSGGTNRSRRRGNFDCGRP